MGVKHWVARMVVLGVFGFGLGARGEVVGLHSMMEISQGTRLDFEGVFVHSDPNLVLSKYGMTETSYVYDVTSMVSPVTGNADAPLGGNALFSFGTISTAVPWESVGLSLSTTLEGGTYSFTFSAYNENHGLLYSDRHVATVVNGSVADFNSNVFFEGLTSTTPVYSFSVEASDPNYVGDNLTFVSVPEPGAAGVVCVGVLVGWRRRDAGNDE